MVRRSCGFKIVSWMLAKIPFDRCDRPWRGLFAIVLGCTLTVYIAGPCSGCYSCREEMVIAWWRIWRGEDSFCHVSVWSCRCISVESNASFWTRQERGSRLINDHPGPLLHSGVYHCCAWMNWPLLSSSSLLACLFPCGCIWS